MPDEQQVRILNSENGTHYFLYVRPERLVAFVGLASQGGGEPPGAGMPGLSWSAILGLDAIFSRRPKRFPVRDILLWLQGLAPGSSLPRLEAALGRFSALHPPDACEDA